MQEISLPHDESAERAFLGSAMLDAEAVRDIPITPDDFYLSKHKTIWEAFRRIQRKGQSVDYVVLVGELKRGDRLDAVGGPGYITGLISASPSMYGAETYAQIIKEHASRRGIIKAAGDMATKAYNREASVPAIVSEAMTDLTNLQTTTHGAKPFSYWMDGVYTEYQEREKNPVDVWGIPTGLKDLDNITGGMQLSTTMLITGEPGLGKTILATQMCCGMHDFGGAPGFIASLEMKGMAIARRIVSAISRVPTRAIKTGRMDEQQAERFTKAYEQASGMSIYMDDWRGHTTVTFRGECARLKNLYGIKWAMLDYDELLKDRVGKDDTERSKFISGEIQAIAGDLDLFILAIHTKNKAGLGDMKGSKAGLSGSVKAVYDADEIWDLQAGDTDKTVRLIRRKGRESDTSVDFVNLVKIGEGLPMFGAQIRMGADTPAMWGGRV